MNCYVRFMWQKCEIVSTLYVLRIRIASRRFILNTIYWNWSFIVPSGHLEFVLSTIDIAYDA